MSKCVLPKIYIPLCIHAWTPMTLYLSSTRNNMALVRHVVYIYIGWRHRFLTIHTALMSVITYNISSFHATRLMRYAWLIVRILNKIRQRSIQGAVQHKHTYIRVHIMSLFPCFFQTISICEDWNSCCLSDHIVVTSTVITDINSHPVASEHRWLVKAPRWIHSVPDVSGRRSWRCGCQARLKNLHDVTNASHL